MFRTTLDRINGRKVPKFFTSSGRRFIPVYARSYDDNGVAVLKAKDKPVDAYARIQSHAESVDIHYIVDKFTMTGDPSVLNRRVGEFMDTTQLPKSLIEFYQVNAEVTDFFNRLDPSVRAQFNNSVTQFAASYGSDKFNDIFRPKKDQAPEVKPEEVKDHES